VPRYVLRNKRVLLRTEPEVGEDRADRTSHQLTLRLGEADAALLHPGFDRGRASPNDRSPEAGERSRREPSPRDGRRSRTRVPVGATWCVARRRSAVDKGRSASEGVERCREMAANPATRSDLA